MCFYGHSKFRINFDHFKFGFAKDYEDGVWQKINSTKIDTFVDENLLHNT